MPSTKINVPGTRIVISVRKEGAESTSRKYLFANNAITILIRKERYMATPPKRGSGISWRLRSQRGAAIQPRDTARLRTNRVRTNERKTEPTNTPRKKSANGMPPTSGEERSTSLDLLATLGIRI